jgi:coatomer protein complex subunit alpha (xenin)
MFKLALLGGRSEDVLEHIKKGRLLGSVTIGYLKKKGFPEVALQFVQDLETRFNLSLEFGHVAEAFEAAKELKKPAVWERLQKEAIRLGNVEISEKAAIARHDIQGLQFLYLLTGNTVKLAKLNQKVSNDHMTRFNLGLLRGDAEERASVLDDLGLNHLARTTRDSFSPASSAVGTSSLIPRPALNKTVATSNWPMTTTMEEIFAAQWAGLEAAAQAAAERLATAVVEEEEEPVVEEVVKPSVNAAAWGDSDLDAELENVQLPVTVPVGASAAVMSDIVAYGESREKQWLGRRRMVVDLVAAGEFGEALSVLQKRIGLINPAPLEPLFLEIILAAHASVPGLPFSPSISVPIMDTMESPAVLFSVSFLEE